MIELFPLTEISKQIVGSKALLKMLLDPENDTDGSLAQMAKGNLKVSKKIAKAQLSVLSGYDTDKIEQMWKSLKAFLKIKDEFQQQRMEWIFGVADTSKNIANKPRGSYGILNIKEIDDKIVWYKSFLAANQTSLLGKLVESKEHHHSVVLFSIRELIELCIDDDAIFKYLYTMKPYCYQHARFFDWIEPYTEERADYVQRSGAYSAFIQ